MTHGEIESWARLMHLEVTPCEVEALRQIDRLFRKHLWDKDHPESNVSFSEQLQALKQARNEAKVNRGR